MKREEMIVILFGIYYLITLAFFYVADKNNDFMNVFMIFWLFLFGGIAAGAAIWMQYTSYILIMIFTLQTILQILYFLKPFPQDKPLYSVYRKRFAYMILCNLSFNSPAAFFVKVMAKI